MRPTAHLAYSLTNPTNILVHPKEVERKEVSRKERRTLSHIYHRKYKIIRDESTTEKGN